MKNKFYSFINIIGLTIGMASAILILLWIQNELSHDRFYKKTDRIYVANNRDKVNGKIMAWHTTPAPLGLAVKKDYPEVEDVVRVQEYAANFLLTAGDKHFSLHGEFADTGFFNMFSFPLLEGNASTALSKPNNIVLTKQLAVKLFGNDNAVGKTVRIDSSDYFTVSAVMKDLTSNTRFNFEYVLPWDYAVRKHMIDSNWNNNNIFTYILLKPNASQAAFDTKLKNITIEHTKGTAYPSTTQVFTQALKDTWLYDKEENGNYVGGRIERVRLFAIIAALILIIACINFMNLSTARSEKRSKEVGIRKVAGAQRSALVVQFIAESILLALIAGVFAIMIVQLALPAYNNVLGLKLFIDFHSASNWLFALAFILFTGLIAGIYPALYLSSFLPVKVLKGTFKSSNKVVTPRKVLVVLQFTFAIMLIISTMIIKNQIDYAQKRDMGYSKDNLAFIIEFGDAHRNYELIKRDLISSGAATAVAQTSAPMTESWGDSWGFEWNGSTEDDKKIDFNMFSADEDFQKAIGVKIIEGRGIDAYTYKTDSSACLLNEASVKAMRLKNPIGTIIRNGSDSLHVVGIIKDFILGTPYEPIQQMIIVGPIFSGHVINFKLNPNPSIAASLKKAERVFQQYNPQYPFNVRFYDEEYDKKFHDEKQTAILAGLFAALTIFISCLGLLGLAAYVAQTRIKEIGVRKVLGASVQGIVALLSKDFLMLVLISFVIASPVAWMIMHKWLASYSYRVNISIWVFVIAGCLSAAIAFITVSFQAIKAAIANPVKSLRTE
ncbi:ABC transporter permease [Parafilimonas sp.]|uniref:ABC transporter permease n=1 Tax=Parafilimonas sp. TaxID=1969739 RepID=UPI003F7DE81E